ncbi:TIGR00266 family protein [Paenibacillus caui]|uniref:TIGR00266 family protein n=1 Tax=Paenibacillus caui TaxID=2873927 RepID=UPI001CA87DDD|nr:TIGR00266 family protein [Paenibacillus caui]
MSAHEIDYMIHGNEMQCVEVQLDPGESVIAEAGSFMMMDPDIRMETVFGDGRGGGGGMLGKLMGAGRRLLTGESLFMTVFTHAGHYGRQSVTFASPYPGKIIPLDLLQYGGKIICQKDSFLCAAKGVSIGIEFQRKLGAGFFGGEGFIMQKLEGDGLGFVHAGGHVMEKELAPGEVLRLDTGCLVAFTSSVDYDIEFVKGIKSALFGGEGLFFATLRGPGKVWVQSLPFNRMADRILAASAGFGRKEEGSLLGGLGNLLDGK